MTEIVIIPGGITDREELERARGMRAADCFKHMLKAAKEQIDQVNWYALGLGEAEAAMAAWQNGSPHGFFEIWRERHSTVGANRGAPSMTEQEARRLAILLCVALERIGLGKRTSKSVREFTAQALGHVFIKPPSWRTIEYWQNSRPELTPQDELLIATALVSCGPSPHRLAYFFVGHIHLVADPAAVVRFELEP